MPWPKNGNVKILNKKMCPNSPKKRALGGSSLEGKIEQVKLFSVFTGSAADENFKTCLDVEIAGKEDGKLFV